MRTHANLARIVPLVVCLVSAGLHAANPKPPNILLITADDMNWDSVGVFGCPVPGTTPHLDRLAREGMRFTNAHVTVAVCAPSRAVLMNGRYPHRTGAEGFGPIRGDVKTLTELLGERGYLCGIIGKSGHLKPVDKYSWTRIYDGVATGNGRAPVRYGRFTAEFIQLAREAGKPFFLMANSRDPHRPFAGSQQEKQYIEAPRNRDEQNWANPQALPLMEPPSRTFAPHEVVVPGFLPDVPDIREEVAHYYNSVRRCDDAVGAILRALEESGEAANTLVVFLSDNGMPFPFAKFSCYLHGTRTPLIVRWPGRIRADAVNAEMIGGIDLAPTMLEAAGVQPPPEMDGRSFLGLLTGSSQERRERVFTAFYITALAEQVPTRAVQEQRYGYIFNRWADGATQCQDEAHKGLALQAMIAAGGTNPQAAQRVVHFLFRIPEELYDFAADPDGLHNLSHNPAHRGTLIRMRGALLDWMRETGDPIADAFQAHLAGRLAPMSGPKDPGEVRGATRKGSGG